MAAWTPSRRPSLRSKLASSTRRSSARACLPVASIEPMAGVSGRLESCLWPGRPGYRVST
jgi:hypothetical protein